MTSQLSTQLASIHSIPDLTAALSPPLRAFAFLPSLAPTDPDPALFLRRQLQPVQLALLRTVWLVWVPAAAEGAEQDGLKELLRLYFVPSTTAQGGWGAEVALSALSSLLSFLSLSSPASSSTTKTAQHVQLATTLLQDLLVTWPMHSIAADLSEKKDVAIRDETWEFYVKDLGKVVGRVANAWGGIGRPRDVPDFFLHSNFQADLCASYIHLLSSSKSTSLLVPPIPLLIPVLPSHLLPFLLPPPFPSPPDTLMSHSKTLNIYHALLPLLPSATKHAFLTSSLALLSSLSATPGLPATTLGTAMWVLAGRAERQTMGILLDSRAAWGTGMGKAAGLWMDREGEDVDWVLKEVEEAWCDESSVKNGSIGSRIFLTTLLLLLLNSHPSSAEALSHAPHFLSAISLHLSHQVTKTRLLGMMVAEEVSFLVHGSKKLDFGAETWEGEEGRDVQSLRMGLTGSVEEEGGKEVGLAVLRGVLSGRTVAKHHQKATLKKPVLKTAQVAPLAPPPARPLIVEIDPDDLTPYALPSAPPSSFLEDLESPDPSLYSTLLPKPSASSTRPRGKLRPPVYVAELTEYLRGKDPEGRKEEGEEEAERVLVGLREGEGLVRRKTGWGGELDENAMDLVLVLAGLQDQFETEDFERQKLGIMTALVVGAPTKVAPAIIEHYFLPNYSLVQRHAILTSLALGARELAGLPIPPPSSSNYSSIPLPLPQPAPPITLFPSKQLPPALHSRLVPVPPSAPALPSGALETIVTTLTDDALSSARDDAETTIPQARKEKLLTVRRFASARPTPSIASGNGREAFATLAAEYFILPLVNRFFLHLRDVSTSTLARGLSPYGSAGAGSFLLDALLLPTFLGTLAVLLHASRHSPHFLAMLAPEAIELLLVLRAAGDGAEGELEDKVLQAQMEVLLVVFDTVVSLDHGASLMREKSEMVGEVKEWAEEVFEREERRPSGVGAVGRAAAGVLLRIDEVLRKWRGKVGW